MEDSFALRLRGAMTAEQITVESLALESGFSVKYITDLRNGHKTNPTLFAVRCLAHVLHVSPSYLAGWSEGYDYVHPAQRTQENQGHTA